MRRTLAGTLLPLAVIALAAAAGAWAGSVTSPTNRHNLSASGPGIPGVTRAVDEERVCVFCHIPHHANSAEGQQTPLWSRDLSVRTYDLYASSTLRVSPQQPTGSSRLCLSCHDGTIALGKQAGGAILGGLSAPMPLGDANLGEGGVMPDISNDHPISFEFPSGADELVDPTTQSPPLKLEEGMVQCVSCHDPHDDTFPNFLVVDNRLPSSPLCTSCHQKTGWDVSSHNGLTVTLPASGGDPGETVSGCGICHKPHSAPQRENLVRGNDGLQTCTLACHNGSIPESERGRNVLNAISATFRHPAGDAPGRHLAAENTLAALPADGHVDCVDCHNPHRVNASLPATPGAVSGALVGVRAEYLPPSDFRLADTQYDVCFKCHAESFDSFAPPAENLPVRVYDNHNQRERFSLANSSYHPVMGKIDPVKVTNLTGLKTSFTRRDGTQVMLDLNTILYCTDCHQPHGSGNEHMLLTYYQQDTLPSSYFSYDAALCFRCHEESRLFDGTSSFPQHRLHIANPDGDPRLSYVIPCSVCHDPHGVFSSPRLINFDTRIGFVSPTTPPPVYNHVERSCTVSCHTSADKKHAY